MLSRLAENLYWMGRYVERAENTARLLDVNYHAIVEAPMVPGARSLVAEQWAPLLSITGDEAGFREHFSKADAGSVPEWLAVHPKNPSSIRSSLLFARENARTLRDRISVEMWEALNRAYLTLCEGVDGSFESETLHDYCVSAREASHLFFGIAGATLPRNLGWYFLKMGQYLERADNVLRLLMVRYRQYRGQEPVIRGIETHRGMALLKSVSAYEAFRKRHQSALDPERIAAFLLLDPDFPRSLRFSVRMLFETLKDIAALNPGTDPEPRRQAGWLSSRLEFLRDAREITEHEAPSLEELLTDLAALSEAVANVYFDQAPLIASQNQSQSQSQSGLQRQTGSQSQSQSQSGRGSQSQSQGQSRIRKGK